MAASERYDVIVVGGGHNGLVAAFYLAAEGLKTVVLERRPFVGGACVTEELFHGYRVSSCSYVCWMLHPKVIRDLSLGRHGFSYVPMDPVTFIPYSDGAHVFRWINQSRTVEEIAKLNHRDAERYPEWVDMWRRASNLVAPFLLGPRPPDIVDLERHAHAIAEMALLDELRSTSIADMAERYFRDVRVQAMAVQVGDVGDPWTPGSAWPEAYFHPSGTGGLGYSVVTGGMGGVTMAMMRACLEQGVEVRTDTDVRRILVDNNRAVGVELANGSFLRADRILSNADPKRTFLELLDERDIPRDTRRSFECLSTNVSYLKFHCVMRRLPDIRSYIGREPSPRETGYVSISPSLQHFRQAAEEVSMGIPVKEPIIHMQVPTVYDSSLTGRDGHIVSIWALYAPPKLAVSSWEAERERVGEDLIDYVTCIHTELSSRHSRVATVHPG